MLQCAVIWKNRPHPPHPQLCHCLWPLYSIGGNSNIKGVFTRSINVAGYAMVSFNAVLLWFQKTVLKIAPLLQHLFHSIVLILYLQSMYFLVLLAAFLFCYMCMMRFVFPFLTYYSPCVTYLIEKLYTVVCMVKSSGYSCHCITGWWLIIARSAYHVTHTTGL